MSNDPFATDTRGRFTPTVTNLIMPRPRSRILGPGIAYSNNSAGFSINSRSSLR